MTGVKKLIFCYSPIFKHFQIIFKYNDFLNYVGKKSFKNKTSKNIMKYSGLNMLVAIIIWRRINE